MKKREKEKKKKYMNQWNIKQNKKWETWVHAPEI